MESYPSPSSDIMNPLLEHRKIRIRHFAEDCDGLVKCRLVSEDGCCLLDSTFQSKLSPQVKSIMEYATETSSSRQQKLKLIPTCTISKGLLTDQEANELDTSNAQKFNIIFKVTIPSATDLSDSVGLGGDNVLGRFVPELAAAPAKPWTPREFYDNVHITQASDASPDLPGIEELQCQLYPFQRRAVRWLLQREGVGQLEKSSQVNQVLPHGFVHSNDAEGRLCVVSQFLGLVSTDTELPFRLGPEPRGGILAEEMGLGKTVEMIALMCLHKRDGRSDPRVRTDLPESSATLIITPPAILQQWKKEFETLSPQFRVMIYEGVKIESGRADHEALITRCIDHDVVLTTYNVLAREIHYAEKPIRELRHEKKYEKRLSPLTQILWWRVILDEAQMMESGVSNAAKVAELIPRQLAWCISGTPVKKDSKDLLGLLVFLHYRPYSSLRVQSWGRLLSQYKDIFKFIFGNLALRHTKDQIKGEIQLPPQKRVVITVPFTAIEEQNYSTLFKEMSEDCGLDTNGAPLTEDWDPESAIVIEKMRNWLIRLRQTCLHPEVGAKNRKALGSSKGPLRTVGEVLEVMIEQNDTALRSEERACLLSQVRRGQILEHVELSEEALDIWQDALQQASSIVGECRNQLKAELHRMGLTEELSSLGEMPDMDTATAARTGPHRQRLRAAIEVEHMCTFFVANAYFQIKSDETRIKPQSNDFYELEQKEESTYEAAKLLRKELLQESRKKAETSMEKINLKVADQSVAVFPSLPPLEDRIGIESRAMIDRMNDLLKVMQDQKKQLIQWREKAIKLLVLPLVDEVCVSIDTRTRFLIMRT